MCRGFGSPLPVSCLLRTLCFWKWSLDRIFSVIVFDLENQPPPVYFSPTWVKKPAGLSPLLKQAKATQPQLRDSLASAVKFLWSWGCERHRAFPAVAGAQAVTVPDKSAQGLLSRAGTWHPVNCGLSVGLLLFALPNGTKWFLSYSVYVTLFFPSGPREYQCSFGCR